MAGRAVVAGLGGGVEVVGPQLQWLTPVITGATAGAGALSGGVVRMPPGGVSRAHVHERSEIIVVVLTGQAATVVWEGGRPRVLPHRYGQMCYVPAGVAHCAVNVSCTGGLVAFEFRTDPDFNADVVLLPELEPEIPDIVAALRAAHGAGALQDPPLARDNTMAGG